MPLDTHTLQELRHLAQDASRVGRGRLSRRLRGLLTHDEPEVSEAAFAIMVELLPAMALEDRQAVLAGVCDGALGVKLHAPLMQAGDLVACSYVQAAPRLPVGLWDRVLNEGDEALKVALAGRADLGDSQVARLVASQSTPVLTALLCNRHVRFTPEILERLGQMAVTRPLLQTPLIDHAQFEIEGAARLYWWLDHGGRDRLAARFALQGPLLARALVAQLEPMLRRAQSMGPQACADLAADLHEAEVRSDVVLRTMMDILGPASVAPGSPLRAWLKLSLKLGSEAVAFLLSPPGADRLGIVGAVLGWQGEQVEALRALVVPDDDGDKGEPDEAAPSIATPGVSPQRARQILDQWSRVPASLHQGYGLEG